jgi:hypothetical protein
MEIKTRAPLDPIRATVLPQTIHNKRHTRLVDHTRYANRTVIYIVNTPHARPPSGRGPTGESDGGGVGAPGPRWSNKNRGPHLTAALLNQRIGRRTAYRSRPRRPAGPPSYFLSSAASSRSVPERADSRIRSAAMSGDVPQHRESWGLRWWARISEVPGDCNDDFLIHQKTCGRWASE